MQHRLKTDSAKLHSYFHFDSRHLSFMGQGQGWGHFSPTSLHLFSIHVSSELVRTDTPHRHGCATRRHCVWSNGGSGVTRHTALRAGARVPARGAHTGPPDKPTNTPHEGYQLVRRGAGSVEPGLSLAPSNEGSPPLCSVQLVCSRTTHDTHAVRQCAERQQLWPVSHRVTL